MVGNEGGDRHELERDRRARQAGGRGEGQLCDDRVDGDRFPVVRFQRRDELGAVVAHERDSRVDERSCNRRQAHFAAAAASGFPTGVEVIARMKIAIRPETKNAPVGPISVAQSTAPRYWRAAGPIASARPTDIVL